MSQRDRKLENPTLGNSSDMDEEEFDESLVDNLLKELSRPAEDKKPSDVRQKVADQLQEAQHIKEGFNRLIDFIKKPHKPKTIHDVRRETGLQKYSNFETPQEKGLQLKKTA